ncbi:MAG TPA: glycosyltransferase family 4 protein [Ottowia sp.]|uniref:glycosyltransferase family 4 protein n=1 Tax=Ottowia sp. TaxID=1898956 RepID=UPI002C393B96|nr:glycosyltransferase family 4 protein [Ottowia sp.]HMN19845.1 glycosyltransferase family 4 protein [Ottowia sp.]
MKTEPAIWFPAVRCDTGTDVFTETLVRGLRQRGLQAEITWLPLRTEYAPWTVPAPKPPAWANVVHINTWLHPRFIPRGLPVLATLHHSIHDPALLPYKGWARAAYHRHWIHRVERATMQRADMVVAVSQFAADTARQHVLDRPMQVIYNGVDTKRFHPPAVRRLHHPFRLLYVGSWMARKGVDLLAPIMRELGDDFLLHYTGGPAAQKDKAGMPGNMRDLGRIDTEGVIRAMQEADALLFPSRSEGMPLCLLEAISCGLPVIAVRQTAATELVDSTVGVLVDRDDVAGFVCAVQHLAAYYEQPSSSSIQSVAAMTDAYASLYVELCK